MEQINSPIRYLNTDLDLICNVDPAVLASELEAHDLFVNVTPGEDDLFYVLCEDMNDNEPEPNIRKMIDAIESLSDAAQKIWAQCSKLEFNIGYDCGDEPWAFNQGLSNDVIKRIANCGTSLRITLYPSKRA